MILEFKKPAITKESIHLNAIINQMKRYYRPENMSSLDIVRVITPFLIYLQRYGLAATFNTLKSTQEILTIMTILTGRLTPEEIMIYFPITKYYQGDKWGVKDYFYTLDYLATIPTDEPIGESFEEIFSFIWEYQNPKIKALGIAIMRNLDKFQEMTGRETFVDHLMVAHQKPQALNLKVIKGEEKV